MKILIFGINVKKNDKRVKIVGKSIQDLLNVSDLHVAKSGCLTLPEASLLEINTIELLSLSESSKQILFDNHMFLGTYNIEKFLEIEQDLHNILNNEINNEIKNNHKNKLKKYRKLFLGMMAKDVLSTLKF